MKRKKSSLLGSRFRRYSDGGAPVATPPPAPAPAQSAETGVVPPTPNAAAQPSPPPAPAQPTPSQQQAAQNTQGKAPETPAKTYTETDMETAKQKVLEDYKQHLQEATDYSKMTPEEKVAHLEKQMADEKLTRYTSEALSKAGMDVSLAAFAKGTDEKSTDEQIKLLKAAIDKVVQAGVEQRFKANGYIPRTGGLTTGTSETEKKPRGVSVK